MVLKLPGTHRPTLRFCAFWIIKDIKLPGFELKHFTFAGEDPYKAHGHHCDVTNFYECDFFKKLEYEKN